MCPVGSVFLLRAAPDVAQQSNPNMAVSAAIVACKVAWLVRVHGLLNDEYIIQSVAQAYMEKRKLIRVLPTGVEPTYMTFQLLNQILYH